MASALSPSSSFLRSSLPSRCLLPPMHVGSSRALSSQTRLFPTSRQTIRRKPIKFHFRAARTESATVSLGARAPYFELPEPLSGKVWTLDDFESCPGFLVMFICNHCPFVKHLKKDISKLSTFYIGKGLGVVAISSNSTATHPQDGPQFIAEEAKLFNYSFPYLFDEDGRRPFELFYHGQFDDSRPSNNVPVTGRDLSRAIDCVLSGQRLNTIQRPSVGCSIKWHPEKTP